MKKKTIIIISVVIGIILLVALIVAGIFLLPKFFNKNEKKKDLEWGEVYLEVLNDENKLEDMDEQKIQLCDLDKDSIPEMIIYGIKNAKEFIANIYKINDKNEVDTVKVSLDKDFELKLLYSAEVDDYVWCAVSKDSDSKEVYDLNISNETYKPELIQDENFEEDYFEIEDNYSGIVDFDKNDSKDKKEEVLKKAQDEYVSTDDMLTDEVKEMADGLRTLKNLKRKDNSKPIVYSVREYVDEYGAKYEYPALNIDSADADKINAEIEENYGFTKEDEPNLEGMELVDISYSYNINKKNLSLVVKEGGNESVWASSYVVNLENGSRLKTDELLENENLNKSDVIENVKKASINDFNTQIEKEKKSYGNTSWSGMGYDKSESEWKSDLEKNVDELQNLYFNGDGDLCVIIEYRHSGGQWSCTKSLIINISNDYSVEELKLDYKMPVSNENTTTPEPSSVAPTQTTTPSTNTQTSSSSSSKKLTDIKFATNPTTTVGEGTYKRGTDGTITVTNSKKGSFDFEINCTYMTAAGYPNMGMLQGTAKETSDSNFAYVERKSQGGQYNYTVIFHIADGGIVIEDESEDGYSPYCGHNVTFRGTFVQ